MAKDWISGKGLSAGFASSPEEGFGAIRPICGRQRSILVRIEGGKWLDYSRALRFVAWKGKKDAR
jgi:hypothetical protein